MTLLVRAVGGGKLTPYESNCWKSLRVCVCVRACLGARSRPPSAARLLRERTSDGAAGPMAANRSELDEVKTARGQVSKRRHYHWQLSHFSELCQFIGVF